MANTLQISRNFKVLLRKLCEYQESLKSYGEPSVNIKKFQSDAANTRQTLTFLANMQ